MSFIIEALSGGFSGDLLNPQAVSQDAVNLAVENANILLQNVADTHGNPSPYLVHAFQDAYNDAAGPGVTPLALDSLWGPKTNAAAQSTKSFAYTAVGYGAEAAASPTGALVPAPPTPPSAAPGSILPAALGATAETGLGWFLITRAHPIFGWFFIIDGVCGFVSKMAKRS